MMAFAKADRQSEVAQVGGRDLAHDGDIAVERGAELPVHFEVVVQVLPAVAGAHVAAAGAAEAAAAGHGQRHFVSPGNGDTFAGNIRQARVVAHAAALQMRREQRVDLQTGEQLLVALDANMHQHDRIMGVADDLAGEAVAAFGVAVAHAHGEGVRVDVLELVEHVAAFFMEESLAIGDEELHVADLRAVDGGAVNLVEDAVRDGEPDFAGGGVGGADGVFGAGGPSGFEAGRAEGRALAVEPFVAGIGCHSVSHFLRVIPGPVLPPCEFRYQSRGFGLSLNWVLRSGDLQQNDGEAQCLCCLGESFFPAQECAARWAIVAPRESGGQLQAVGGP